MTQTNKILIVDDEQHVRQLLSKVLRKRDMKYILQQTVVKVSRFFRIIISI